MAILAIDAGTTGVTALMVNDQARVISRGYAEFPQHYPQPGWVEHDPHDIWQATLTAVNDALDGTDEAPTAVGITNQRETVVLWDRETLGSPRNAIVWQDRRTAALADELRAAGYEDGIRLRTGLRLDPYFSGTKLAWLARNEPHTWAQVKSGRVAIGTVDSYVIARMTRGVLHVTDASNASRTLLLDIRTGQWDSGLAALFDVPMDALAEVVPSYGVVGRTEPSVFLGLDLPIAGIAGDQQAALFGQTAFDPGESKNTYGTGSFVLLNTGNRIVHSDTGLLTTIAWQHPNGDLVYALEGSVFVTGAAVQWLRDGLGIIKSASEVEALARTVESTDGLFFVPALTGLGAPDWDPYARGLIIGVTRGTTAAHIARATLEAIAYEVRDVVELMAAETALPIKALQVDGGAATNDLLLQMQADQLQAPVIRSAQLETTGLGAAFLAGLGTGVWSSTDELRALRPASGEFLPGTRNDSDYRRWRAAVERSKGWDQTGN
jgi:glycerol kinase